MEEANTYKTRLLYRVMVGVIENAFDGCDEILRLKPYLNCTEFVYKKAWLAVQVNDFKGGLISIQFGRNGFDEMIKGARFSTDDDMETIKNKVKSLADDMLRFVKANGKMT